MTFDILIFKHCKKYFNNKNRFTFLSSPEKFHKNKLRQCCVEPTIWPNHNIEENHEEDGASEEE